MYRHPTLMRLRWYALTIHTQHLAEAIQYRRLAQSLIV